MRHPCCSERADPGKVGRVLADLVPEWHVEVVQRDSVRLRDNGAVTIRAEPFTLRLLLPEPLVVRLNVADNNVNFRTLASSMVDYETHCFSRTAGMAEGYFNEHECLVVDAEAHHYLMYENPADHRWTLAQVTADRAAFERRVRYLGVRGDDDIADLPVERFTGRRIYLIFLVEFPGYGDRLKKVIISFE